jgi:putative redox protein
VTDTRRTESVHFAGSQGADLAARLDRPVGRPRAYALFAHCFTCSKDVFAASRISRQLAELGIAVLRFDFTGLGHSDGEFANTNFSSNVGDLVAAADWLRAHHAAPALLIGHSLGGAAVLAAAGDIPESTAVVTIGAPSEPKHLKSLLRADVETIEREGTAEVELAGRTFTITKQFLDDASGQKLRDRIGRMKKALLVIHSVFDEIVGIDHAAEIFTAAKHPKSYLSLDRADHLLTDRADATYVAEVVSAWAGRYLPEAEAEGPLGEPGEVVVQESGQGVFTQRVQAGRHALRADEPKSVGGDDFGPNPYEFLLAGLGACTTMTLRMYARHKKLPLDRVTVRLRHKKIHAKDCEDCETGKGKLDEIEREVLIEGDELTDAQRTRLLEIADRCPVHRTLHSEIKVRTRPW